MEPLWIQESRSSWGEKLCISEWEDSDDYRRKNGWKGLDYIHSPSAPVRIIEYYALYKEGGTGTSLTGVAVFTDQCESHKGFCHGGSMCSVMDDIVGWSSFLVTGKCRPWSAFTVQINTKLCKPIPVNSVLKIQAKITKVERRKVYIEASLTDPAHNDVHHATCDGMAVLNKDVL